MHCFIEALTPEGPPEENTLLLALNEALFFCRQSYLQFTHWYWSFIVHIFTASNKKITACDEHLDFIYERKSRAIWIFCTSDRHKNYTHLSNQSKGNCLTTIAFYCRL